MRTTFMWLSIYLLVLTVLAFTYFQAAIAFVVIITTYSLGVEAGKEQCLQ
jgi:hypothetical protein